MKHKSSVRLLLVVGCLVCALYMIHVYYDAKAGSRNNLINSLIAAKIANSSDEVSFIDKHASGHAKHTVILIKGGGLELRLESIGLESINLERVENTSTVKLVTDTQAMMGLKQSTVGYRLHLDDFIARSIIIPESSNEALVLIIY